MNKTNPNRIQSPKLQSATTSLIKYYDTYLTSLVKTLPIRWQRHFSTLGHMTLPIIWAVALAIICLRLLSTEYTHLAYSGLVVIACIPVATILKLLVRRARPDTPYATRMKIKSYSFPSSHAYSATISCGYLALVAFVLLPTALAVCIASLLTLIAVIIGISRIHIGAHYPTDVTAGWILGVGVLYLVTILAL